MSTYAQVSDVRTAAPNVPITASTKPSEQDVQTFLTQLEAELNAILGNLGYVTPVASTATESRAILKDLVVTGGLARVMRARALGTDVSLLEAAKQLEKSYRDRIAALKASDDPFELPDAEQTNGVIKAPADRLQSHADEAFDDFDVDAPRVTRAQGF